MPPSSRPDPDRLAHPHGLCVRSLPRTGWRALLRGWREVSYASRAMRWLFITGIALDVGGALLIIGAILASRAKDVGYEAIAMTGFHGLRIQARSNERAFAWVGGFLLFVGFLLQLVGYAWAFDEWSLLTYGGGVIVMTTIAGAWGARWLGRRFEESARAAAQTVLDDAEREIAAKERGDGLGGES